MPIDTVQHILHLRTQKNKQVMENVTRLWQIEAHAKTAQDILDGLHPWGKNGELHFYNTLPTLLGILGVGTLICGLIIQHYIPFYLSFLLSLFYFLLAFIIYEPSKPIDEVIEKLELKMKLLKFDLHFQKLPSHLYSTSNNILVLSKLKQSFPLFNQGTDYNEIVNYASTTWQDESGKTYPVLLFKYHYVHNLSITDQNGDKTKVSEIKKDLWGAFIFQTPPLGIAASNKRSEFFYPYSILWRTSDIILNKKLKVFGYDHQQLAKTISPSMTLKFDDFFKGLSGDFISHYEENIVCFMGEKDLFRTTSRIPPNEIKNISELRGYLRTLNMPNYEQFKQNMLNFLS